MRAKEDNIPYHDVIPRAREVKKHLSFNIPSAWDERKQQGETSQRVGNGKNTSIFSSQGLGKAKKNVRRHPEGLGREKTKIAYCPRDKKIQNR